MFVSSARAMHGISRNFAIWLLAACALIAGRGTDARVAGESCSAQATFEAGAAAKLESSRSSLTETRYDRTASSLVAPAATMLATCAAGVPAPAWAAPAVSSGSPGLPYSARAPPQSR